MSVGVQVAEQTSQEDRLIAPHGGLLIDRFVPAQSRDRVWVQATDLPKLGLLRRELADLLLIAEGALSPLKGFQDSAQVESILDEGRLPSGLAWTIPITLQAKGISVGPGSELALVDEEGHLRGVMQVEERFHMDLERVAQRVYGTTDPEHPGVKVLRTEDPVRLAGKVQVFAGVGPVDPARMSPLQTRAELGRRGFAEVAAFQTRNPLHRSHEYLLRIALEVSDGLLLHPLVGETKAGDIPADVRMECYRVLVDNYLPKERVLLATLDTAMRYAGPVEAIHHAILRQNYGASRLIVGRDHAGVGKYYGPFDAHARFDRYEAAALAIRPLKVDVTFWCKACGGTASTKSCAHDATQRVELSGTEVRRRLEAGEPLPAEFSRPEVAEVLGRYYRSLK